HLSGWFKENTKITDLSYFLAGTHFKNPSLDLKGQTIFPDWIKTLTQGAADIENVSSAFLQMFYCGSPKGGDTAEPKFEDGDPLSSLGKPSSNRETYTNRNISPVNDNWK
ncbi:MAG: hypothetical protein LBS54_05785, partial [Dysgonamonadaceae bacterium]|nr:hypothetical protein [Dysgonamonadaceae bacterium]